jgi:hypothetical protein
VSAIRVRGLGASYTRKIRPVRYLSSRRTEFGGNGWVPSYVRWLVGLLNEKKSPPQGMSFIKPLGDDKAGSPFSHSPALLRVAGLAIWTPNLVVIERQRPEDNYFIDNDGMLIMLVNIVVEGVFLVDGGC